jgi:anti-sigma regulatory factor (Ser/Thr protein kinase)
MTIGDARHFHSTYLSEPRAVSQARRAVARFARGSGFSSVEAAEIELAVGEACTNAIEHGHVPGATFVVHCVQSCNGDLVIDVVDHGGGIPLSHKSWPRVVPPKEFGGLGRLLIRHLVDAVEELQLSYGTAVRLTRRAPQRIAP